MRVGTGYIGLFHSVLDESGSGLTCPELRGTERVTPGDLSGWFDTDQEPISSLLLHNFPTLTRYIDSQLDKSSWNSGRYSLLQPRGCGLKSSYQSKKKKNIYWLTICDSTP
eukprot:TRINITY_DN16554_c0_g2_i1.p1 TRINITY_DN16554_c0_g2~~TRINITY_DN16554_c0_g2_i1.p1  ORF type:complete len:111 (-),score=5.85 TRINITY_DN16554_c0_g2_i1:761-1093(-)